jgi:dihydroorotase
MMGLRPNPSGPDVAGGPNPVGAPLADLEISRAWLVDPASGREGPGEVVVRGGVLRAVTWLRGSEAAGIGPDGVVVAPGFLDLHAHLREPGDEAAETIASGLAAAAHGGFTSVVAMADTAPAADEPGVLARVRALAAASGSPVRLLPAGALSAGRAGERLAALGELADAGSAVFSDDPSFVRSPSLLRNALAYAGMLGVPVVEHALDPSFAAGAEAADGLVATVLGLKGSLAAAEASAVARDLAILADVVRDVPGARLHLAHLSTAEALDLVRRAKAAGLPVTCDVSPHHLALTDAWLAGGRNWAWEGSGNPWADGPLSAAPYAASLRADPPLRPAADALACLAALADGTADAIASDHRPVARPDREVEFGAAAPGIAGLETALGLVLAVVDAGHLTLARAIAALTTGPAAVLGSRAPHRPGLTVGAPADLVIFDRSERWTPGPTTLQTHAAPSPLAGRPLLGVVLLTIANGRLAWEAPEA